MPHATLQRDRVVVGEGPAHPDALRGGRVQQSTIARRVAWNGIGLHGGEHAEVALCPAEANTGIVFVALGASSKGGDVEIPARIDHVLSASRATTLAFAGTGKGDLRPDGERVSLGTVEHLLATLFAHEIDNVRVEVRGSEIPVMDGSAAPLVELVKAAGRHVQSTPVRELEVREDLSIEEGDRSVRVEPADALRISYAIDFPHPCIGRQSLEVSSFGEAYFARELAPARTFGFVHEIEALREAGLAHGGSFANAIVLDEEKVLNEGGLRWPDEFVRHKVIDLLGDLALIGMRLKAHVRVEKGGHRLHHRLVRALIDLDLDRDAQDAKSSSSRASAPVLAGSVN